MKKLYQNYKILLFLLLTSYAMVACNEFLDKQPYSVNPSSFFQTDADLLAYVLPRYLDFPTHNGYNIGALQSADNGTDNQIQRTMGSRWIPGEWKVPQSEGEWSKKDNWIKLYNINYFLRTVVPKYEQISGTQAEVKHCIGEMYFFRAYFYFSKLKTLGDLPIVYTALPDQKEPLLEASIRQPRNKVARMILTDLDSAYNFMYSTPKGGKNRLTPAAVQLFRSRVALFEGTWEKNFAGTAFVPNGEGWPGQSTHPSYEYNNAEEVQYFLNEAMKSAKEVADNYPLAENPPAYDYTKNDGSNNPTSDYFEMFGTINQGLDADQFKEVLLYRAYNASQQVAHYTGSYLINGGNTGYTHQFMMSFLMRNGLPTYAAGSGFVGDDSVNCMKTDRDSRFQLFVKGQGEILNDGAKNKEPYKAPLFDLQEQQSITGYMIKKGISRDPSQTTTGSWGTTGSIIFRAAEAYLNYIEACYEKSGTLDGDADKYWKAIRKRANVDENYPLTIAQTNMTIESQNDLGAYTAENVIDPTKYNIRRERRCEFIAEGMRMDDLLRWRSLDQLQNNKFMPKGFNLWSNFYMRYTPYSAPSETPEIREATEIETGSVSAKNDPYADNKYLIPFRLNLTANNLYKDGVSWHPAHYLYPIASSHFLDATPTPPNGSSANVENSVIYQNPGWERIANTAPGNVGGF